MRVMAADGLTPPPSLSERCAAADGLCRMDPKKALGYQPQYAAYEIGQFVTDFVVAYNNDLSKKGHSQGWKLLAAQLSLALGAFSNNNAGRDKYIDEVIKHATELLKEVDETTSVDPAPLSDWLARNHPTAKSLYKDDASSVVRTTAGG
jgi:hypothetical protein